MMDRFRHPVRGAAHSAAMQTRDLPQGFKRSRIGDAAFACCVASGMTMDYKREANS